MYTRIIGDIHGKVPDYRMVAGENPSIQLGDFGVGFSSNAGWYNSVNKFQQDNKHRFIRGNHDKPESCKKMPGYIADGTIEGTTMFVGGAWSIDNPNAEDGWFKRTKDVNWWEDEECSDKEFETIFESYKKHKPRVMITHDFPTEASYYMFFKSGLAFSGKQNYTRTADWFQKMFYEHKPDFWFGGHWHHTTHLSLYGTHFQCLAELDYVDFDLETLEFKL